MFPGSQAANIECKKAFLKIFFLHLFFTNVLSVIHIQFNPASFSIYLKNRMIRDKDYHKIEMFFVAEFWIVKLRKN